jgi:hypothetical protein
MGNKRIVKSSKLITIIAKATTINIVLLEAMGGRSSIRGRVNMGMLLLSLLLSVPCRMLAARPRECTSREHYVTFLFVALLTFTPDLK